MLRLKSALTFFNISFSEYIIGRTKKEGGTMVKIRGVGKINTRGRYKRIGFLNPRRGYVLMNISPGCFSAIEKNTFIKEVFGLR